MNDLLDDDFDAPGPASNAPEYSVSEISGAVKKTLEGAFGRVRVRGEVGRVFKARSGHLYYDIKDDRNVLACTTWKGQIAGLSIVPEEGMEVVVTGRLTAFGAQSKYNLNAEQVEIAGAGALMAMLEKRKKQLEAEGLFAPERKRPLPYLPEVIGVVTSPSGAVIRDILHRLRDRFPRKVLIWPVAVQGRDCAAQVAAAIEGFNRLSPGGAVPRPDVLIVARGGGSIEDLWGFNEEIVARAAAASEIPLISAVGHETDTTLIDHVSDRRAPTPSAAAEMAVPVRLDLMAHVDGQGARLSGAVARAMARRGERLRDLGRAMPKKDALLAAPRQRLDLATVRLPTALINGVQQRRVILARRSASLRPGFLSARLRAASDRVTSLSSRLRPALDRRFERAQERLDARVSRLSIQPIRRQADRGRADLARVGRRFDLAWDGQSGRRAQRLESLSRVLMGLGYEGTLRRGYAVVRASGKVVTSRAEAAAAQALDLQFHDGHMSVAGAVEPAPDSKPARAAPKKKRSKPEQGDLF